MHCWDTTRTAILLNITVQWIDTGQLIFHHENAGLFLVLYQHSFGEGSQDFFVAGKHIPPLAFLLLREETCNVRECCELSGGTGGTAGESSVGDQRSPSQEAANIWAGRSSGPKQHVHHGSTVTLLASKKGVPVGRRHRSLSEIGADSYLFPSPAQGAEEDIPLCSQKHTEEGTTCLGC